MWCAQTGLTTITRADHAAYLAGWLRILRSDARALVTVASRAQAAVDWLNAHTGHTTSDTAELVEREEAQGVAEDDGDAAALVGAGLAAQAAEDQREGDQVARLHDAREDQHLGHEAAKRRKAQQRKRAHRKQQAGKGQHAAPGGGGQVQHAAPSALQQALHAAAQRVGADQVLDRQFELFGASDHRRTHRVPPLSRLWVARFPRTGRRRAVGG